MNCKPGDLAFVIKSVAGNEGRIVRVLKFVGVVNFSDLGPVGNCWLVEGRLTNSQAWHTVRNCDGCFSDAWLRPIRPGDVTDEEVRDLYAPDRSMKDSPPSDTTSPSEKKEVA